MTESSPTPYWDRIAAGRISRRRALRGAGALAASAGLIALAGCGETADAPVPLGTAVAPADPSKPDALNPAGPPRRGGRLVSAVSASLGSFDPHTGIAVASAYFPRVYNVLVNQSAARPEFYYHDLAESFEVPDEQTWIFQIRPGVKVSPNSLGVPERDLDGDDVRVTLERIAADPATNNNGFARDHIESVRVTGNSVVIGTPAPYAWFLARIGHFFNTIPPRELLLGDSSRLTFQAAGAGPYRLVAFTEEDAARFDRNPNYYRRDPDNSGAQLPYVDGLDVRIILDKAAQLTAFRSGQIHSYLTGSSAEARSLDDAVIAREPFFTYISFTMNPGRAPFTDPRVRRAFSRAINRQQFVDIIYGGDAQPDGLVQWSLGSYALPPDELAALQPYDLEEARRLVREVGGIRVKMMYPVTPIVEHDQHVPIFAQQMREAGIELVLDPQDFATWLSNLKDIKYECTLNLNQIYETPELPLNIHTTRGPFGDGTYLAGLGDPAIEQAVRAASTALDADARIEAVREAQRVIYARDPISLPLVTPYQHVAWRKNVKNIPAGIGTSSFLVNTFWMDV